MRDKERILELADLIEGLPDRSFDMSSYTVCGTPLCLAGWAAWLAQGRPEDAEGCPVLKLAENGTIYETDYRIVREAAEWLGLDGDEFQLADDRLFRGEYSEYENQRLTREMAVAHLRRVADGGALTWPKVPE